MKITKNLTEGNIYRNLILYALPLILSSMLSQAYSTVDGIIAGKCIGEFALGAVSATGSFDTLFLSLMGGFATGYAIYVSHIYGSGQFGMIKRDILAMTGLVGLIAIAISVISILLREPIMSYLKVDPLLSADAERYFIIYTAGFAVYFINQLLIHTLYALGVTSFSLYISLLSAILNIGGNLLTVQVFGMGVAGLALSTLLSSAVATVCYVCLLRGAFREMRCEEVSARFDLSGIAHSLRYSLPAALQQMTFHGIGFLIAPSINGLGAAATTGYNIANRIYGIGTQSLWAVTSAFSCYTGQCVGKGDCEKIRRGLRAGFILNVAAMLPPVLILALLAHPIVSLFFPATHMGEAYGYAIRYATVFLPFVYIQLVGHILHSYMRSLGCVSTVLWITLVGSVTRVVATLMLVPLLRLDGVFLAQIISWTLDAFISVILCLTCYRKPAQLERLIRRAHISGK